MKKPRFDRRTELLQKNSGSAPDKILGSANKTLGSAEKPMRGDMSLCSISDSGDNACCVLQNPGRADDGGMSTQADDDPESEASYQQSRIKLAAMLGETIRLLEDASKLKVGFIELEKSENLRI